MQDEDIIMKIAINIPELSMIWFRPGIQRTDKWNCTWQGFLTGWNSIQSWINLFYKIEDIALNPITLTSSSSVSENKRQQKLQTKENKFASESILISLTSSWNWPSGSILALRCLKSQFRQISSAQKLWFGVTVVEALAPSRLIHDSVCNSGNNAIDFEVRKMRSIANW